MKYQFSAGGVVYKKDPDLKILVAQHSYHHGWVFPKGLIGDKEENVHQTKEETAVREVKEETGIDAEIEKQLSPIWFYYSWKHERPDKKTDSDDEKEQIKKTVYYFLMRGVGGDINVHDNEMENVEWIPAHDVEKRLSYPSDKRVWKEARELLEV